MSKTHNRSNSAIAPNRIFYWAYGSNLSIRQMKRRCPQAIKYGPMDVQDCALIFRAVADVTLREGAVTQGGLWQITTQCERELDAFEGVNSGRYMKRYFRITIHGKKYTCLFYQMRAKEGVLPPTERYLETIVDGYRDFGLDLRNLETALHDAWGNKEVTETLARRHERKGNPILARAISMDPLDALEHIPSHLLPAMWEDTQ